MASEKIVIDIPGLPPMANGSHGSWQKKFGVTKAWKKRVGWYLLGHVPKVPHRHIVVKFTRFSSVEPDFDGLVHGFKPIRDALVEYGFVVGDKMSNMRAEYRWEKAPVKKGKIRIEILEAQ